MGFGLGAAIGAAIGTGERRALVIGDGGFGMCLNELATAVTYHVPVVILLMNNGVLGMVRQWQTLIKGKRYSQTNLDRGPDFVKLAEAYGLKGRRVATVAELEDAIKEAVSWGHGYVIDCAIDMDEMVKPMVAGGSHITKFIVC